MVRKQKRALAFKPFKRTHTMERLPMTPLEKLGEALETCIVACAGRRNTERAQAVLDVIKEQGWTLMPPGAVSPRTSMEAALECLVDDNDACSAILILKTALVPPEEEK